MAGSSGDGSRGLNWRSTAELWSPAKGKPEILATESLSWADPPSAFAGLLPDSHQAALGVLAAALLV
jgi:hypothetical protein